LQINNERSLQLQLSELTKKLRDQNNMFRTDWDLNNERLQEAEMENKKLIMELRSAKERVEIAERNDRELNGKYKRKEEILRELNKKAEGIEHRATDFKESFTYLEREIKSTKHKLSVMERETKDLKMKLQTEQDLKDLASSRLNRLHHDIRTNQRVKVRRDVGSDSKGQRKPRYRSAKVLDKDEDYVRVLFDPDPLVEDGGNLEVRSHWVPVFSVVPNVLPTQGSK